MGWRVGLANWIRRSAHRLAYRIAGADLPQEDDRELFLALFDGLESLAEGFIVCDADGRVIYFNKQYKKIFPRIADVVRVGMPVSELLDTAIERGMFAEEMGCNVRDLRLAALSVSDEKPFYQRLSDGRMIQTRDQRTKTGGYVGIRTDVTEVQHGRDMLQSLIDNIPELVTLKDKQGQYFFVNKCFEDWTGTRRESIIGKSVFDVYSKEEAERYLERDRRIAETLSPEVEEVEIRFPDGLKRTVLLIAFPVQDQFGAFDGSGVICIDISERKRSQLALEEKESQLRAALDNMSSGLMMADSDLVIRTVNRRLVELYDFPKYLARPGSSLRSIIEFRARRGDYGPGVPERQVEERLRMWQANSEQHYQDQVPGDRTIEVRLRAMSNGHSIVVCNEVTEAKRAERELTEKNLLMRLTRNATRIANEAESLQEVLEKSMALICHFMDWQVGHVFRVSEHNRDLLDPSGIWHVEDDASFREFRRLTAKMTFQRGIGLPGRVLEEGKPVWLSDVRLESNFPRARIVEELGVRAGCAFPVRMGEEIFAIVELYSSQVVEPDQSLLDTLEHIGDQIGHVAERERSARDLKASEDRLRLALDHMTGGILMFDRDLKFLVASPQFAEIYDIPPEMTGVGRSGIEVMRYRAKRGDYGPGDPEILLQQRVQGYYSSIQPVVEDHLPDGRIVELFRTKTDDGSTVAVFHEVTDRKLHERQIAEQRDELEQLNQQKAKFFSIIAHDLKDPFGTLMGFLELMKIQADAGNMDKLPEYSSTALDSARIVHKLLENLLEWSWLQMDRVEFNPEVMGIEQILERNLNLFQPVAEAKEIQLIGDLSTDEYIYADMRMIDTVIRNLINNAIKFTPKGGLVTAGVARRGQAVEIFVRDNGVGIPAEKQNQLFRPECKISTSGTEGEMGTGLGLILCKELVESNSGGISVESEVGEGTVFRIELPVSRKEGGEGWICHPAPAHKM